jgi:hypothetical protein
VDRGSGIWRRRELTVHLVARDRRWYAHRLASRSSCTLVWFILCLVVVKKLGEG